jgi:hypothetical protein
MNSRGTPDGIGRGHPRDEGADLGGDARPADGRPGGELRPVVPEAPALPAENGVRRYDHQRVLPAGPHPGRAPPGRADQWRGASAV